MTFTLRLGCDADILSWMIQVILIRHGETDWNADRRIMGHKPIPLNDQGRTQVENLRRHMADVSLDAIYTSPMKRAYETATLVRGERDIPIHETFDLAEIDYGDWVGKTFDEVRRLPQFKDYHRRPSQVDIPAGERFEAVVARVDEFFKRLRAENRSMTVAAVSHADVIKVALTKHLALPIDELHRIRIDNGSYSIVWIEGDVERALVINALPSLEGFFNKGSLFSAMGK